MPRRIEAEGHCRTNKGTGAGIVAAEDAGHVLTGRISAVERRAVVLQDPCDFIRSQAGETADVAGVNPDRAEGFMY